MEHIALRTLIASDRKRTKFVNLSNFRNGNAMLVSKTIKRLTLNEYIHLQFSVKLSENVYFVRAFVKRPTVKPL